MPSIAIFGAGPALGLSTARRFGRAGYDIDLVGRTESTLIRLRDALRTDGLDANLAIADLADPERVREVARELVDQRGAAPDLLLYSPGDVRRLPVAASDLTAETLLSWLPLNLLSPVELIHEVLPAMTDRGSGTIVVAQGSAVRIPTPALASSSVAQAALLNYLAAIAVDAAERGVHVASLQIGQLIERSAAADLFAAGHFDGVEPGGLPTVDPDDLAETIWGISGAPGPVEYATLPS
ncbi:SDR family NAD(P)-dependent oxidoreductase [Agromyces intestinalis]|uniref:SDR family NAD(P)-dependent oxidoreductase n=1 Tax=Agromyces intestinalis TaxID=2592652 RepID=A0A5C1YE23_9MICO|nr:SDR family NAD(P)-dependent oxidoreductase [Agromyces intestinalis]QEO13908.1 SDR family NAD(P)-dependent oxidoreductase [Agromyces intestinalis]